jgi:hypothetical protein
MFSNHRSSRSLALLALVMIGTACPTEDPEGGSAESGDATEGTGSSGLGASSEEGSSTAMDDSTGGSALPECSCVAGEEDFVELVCEVDEICEPVVVSCAEEPLTACELADLVVTNPEVLECHHDALEAGGAQVLRWELPYALDPGVTGQRSMIVMNEDREAITWHESWGAPSYEISDVAVSELRPAAHFDGCVELPSPEEVFRCLYDATETVLGVCVPAHELPIG